jgi:hypothetical protein
VVGKWQLLLGALVEASSVPVFFPEGHPRERACNRGELFANVIKYLVNPDLSRLPNFLLQALEEFA